MTRTLQKARMKCPSCESTNTETIESRGANDGINVRRRKECRECRHRFTTQEILVDEGLPSRLHDSARDLRRMLLAIKYQADGVDEELRKIAPGKIT